MSRCPKKLLSALLIISFFLLNTSLYCSTLKIQVTNVRPKLKGYVLFALYNKEEGFLEKRTVIASLSIKVKRNILEGVYKDIPPGIYSIAIFHDANNNGYLDRFLGIPTEGYGFSRIRAKTLRKPGFQETSIRLKPQETATIIIPMQYLHSNHKP